MIFSSCEQSVFDTSHANSNELLRFFSEENTNVVHQEESDCRALATGPSTGIQPRVYAGLGHAHV
jgi:hypothetical protein